MPPAQAGGAVTRQDIELEDVLGSGACSVVRAATSVAPPHARYAVKIFNVFDDGKRFPAGSGNQTRRVAATPRPRRGHSLEARRGAAAETQSRPRRHQLVAEIRTLAALDCAALVACHGAYLDSATKKVGVILDYMDVGGLDGCLSTRARLRPDAPGLPESATAAICFQCFWGLASAARRRNLHRRGRGGAATTRPRAIHAVAAAAQRSVRGRSTS